MVPEHEKILKMPVAVTSYDHAMEFIFSAAGSGQGKYVCVSNTHMCMESFDCGKFEAIVRDADLTVPDGVPLVWALKSLGKKKAKQVRGADLMMRICREAMGCDLSIGLYGGSPDSLKDLVGFLTVKCPGLSITYAFSPPFRPLTHQENVEVIRNIKSSGVQILFVGIGCPKQEIWMAEHRDKIPCVMIGVGAAFDFFSGRKKHAPRWMQKAGLEWLFRLSSDPGRLWRRYLKNNPRFIWYFGNQLLKKRIQER